MSADATTEPDATPEAEAPTPATAPEPEAAAAPEPEAPAPEAAAPEPTKSAIEVAAEARNTTPLFNERILANLRVPGHDDHECVMALSDEGLRCTIKDELHPLVNGIPSLFRKDSAEAIEITKNVKAFYEENPFPNYDGIEEFGDLVTKGNQNPFTVRLLKAIGYNKTILEAGCGTGQLGNFLQLNNNHHLGIDLSLSSLGAGLEHKLRNGLPRSSFCQQNIFDLGIKDESFDVVIAHGVLHHTFDARKAFECVAKKAKPGGIVMVGLYNSYARVPTWIRAKLMRLGFGQNIDYVVRSRIRDERKADIWIKDQYYHPHETWHSIDETMGWFEENDIEFLNCSPGILETDGEEVEDLFQKCEPGTVSKRVLTQLGWLFTIAREGALFDLIGRKRGGPSA